MTSYRRRTTIDGQFAPRTIDMLRSPAMRVLSLSARRLLDRIEIELADHGGTENGKLPVTYDDFVRFGIHRHAIAPAINEVVQLGFVEITEQGRAGNAEFRSPSLYRLTFRHTDRHNPTNEWKRIQTVADAVIVAAKARGTPRRKKQNPSARKCPVSVSETITENAKSPVSKTVTTTSVRKPSLLSIFR